MSTNCQTALKEWAVTVDALARGQQILLLRKGGIHEDSKDFRVVHPEFLLYPTYEHQREDLLKEDFQSQLGTLLAEVHNPDEIRFTHWAKVEEMVEVSQQEPVDALSPFYIWTNSLRPVQAPLEAHGAALDHPAPGLPNGKPGPGAIHPRVPWVHILGRHHPHG